MRARLTSVVMGVLAAMLLAAGPARATCFPTQPVLPKVDPAAPLAERVATLFGNSRWSDDDHLIAPWRALVADLKRNPAADPELLAIATAGLASELDGDATVPEQLALAIEAERIARTHGLTDRASYGRILVVLISKQIDTGHAIAAEPYAAPLLASARQHFGEHSLEWAEANSAVGGLRYAEGRYVEAETYGVVKRDLLMACLPPDNPRIGHAIMSHGIMLSSTGRLEDALPEEFVAARWAIAHLPERDDLRYQTLNNLGLLLRNVSRLAEADVVLRRAIDLEARYHPDDAIARSNALGNLANVVFAEGGQDDEAEALWARALEYYRKSSNRSNALGASGILRRSGDLAQAHGDIALALDRRELALKEMAGASKTHPELARAQLEYGSTLLLAHRIDEAAALAGPAIAIIRKGVPASDGRRLSSETMYARIRAYKDGPEAGYQALAPVGEALEALMLDPQTTRGELVVYAPLCSSSFTLLAKLALLTGREEAAFRALQLAALSQIVVVSNDMAARAAARDPAERALVVGLQDAVRTRRSLERERSFAVSAQAGTESVQQRIDANDVTIKRLTGDLDTRFPTYRALGRPSPVSLESFRARLTPQQVLLAPLPLEDGTYVMAITRDGFRWGKSSATSIDVRRLIERVRGSIDAAQRSKTARFDKDAARKLYDALLPESLRSLIARHPSMLYYATGRLASVPLALLIAPGGNSAATPWLIRSHDVTVLPTLGPPPARGDTVAGGRFLGVGAPLLGKPIELASRGVLHDATVETGALQSLPSLGDARRELQAMKAVIDASGGLVLAGAQATETAVKALPSAHFAVLAFATHGLIAGDLPGLTEPALVLTPPLRASASDDGLLTASEIAGLKLDADWVILSACNTASGGGSGAPEYAGLASAFVQAGARSLLVSHWPVRDDAAARLTVDTLRQAKTAPTRAIALQRAMLRLMADRHMPGAAHPAVWAPFVLIGQ